MKKKTASAEKESELLVNLTLKDFPVSLLTEFAKKVVYPYYRGNLNAALQDLIYKTLSEQNFVLSHITQIRTLKSSGSKRLL